MRNAIQWLSCTEVVRMASGSVTGCLIVWLALPGLGREERLKNDPSLKICAMPRIIVQWTKFPEPLSPLVCQLISIGVPVQRAITNNRSITRCRSFAKTSNWRTGGNWEHRRKRTAYECRNYCNVISFIVPKKGFEVPIFYWSHLLSIRSKAWP